MYNKFDPTVDQWYYWPHGKGSRFYVVAVDDEARTVEVQHFNGDVEEYSFAEWRKLDVEPGEEPESWTGALDIGEKDDLGTEITDTQGKDWNESDGEYHMEENMSGEDAGGENDYVERYMHEAPLGNNIDLEDLVDLSGLIKRPDGVYEETYSDTWYVEYSEDADTGLWRVNLFKHDAPEFRAGNFESLESAVLAARTYYNQT